MKILSPILMLIVSACSPTWQSSSAVSATGGEARNQIVQASAGNSAQLNGDEVFLILYRESGFIGSATAWPVQYNGEKIGALKNGAFIAIKTNAGSKKLDPESHLGIYSESVEQFVLNANAGRTYYLMHGPDSIYTSKVKFREVDAPEASAEIAKYSLVKVVNDYQGQTDNAVGRVVFVKGRAFIERGIRTLPAKKGVPLQAGDKINVQEGSQAHINLRNSGILKITEKTSFQIPEASGPATPPGLADKAWVKIKDLLKGEDFELKASSTGGVRG